MWTVRDGYNPTRDSMKESRKQKGELEARRQNVCFRSSQVKIRNMTIAPQILKIIRRYITMEKPNQVKNKNTSWAKLIQSILRYIFPTNFDKTKIFHWGLSEKQFKEVFLYFTQNIQGGQGQSQTFDSDNSEMVGPKAEFANIL